MKLGKSKKRMLHKGINDRVSTITRVDALRQVVSAIKKKQSDYEIMDLISLFGFSTEDLLENGVQYEDVLALRGVLSDK